MALPLLGPGLEQKGEPHDRHRNPTSPLWARLLLPLLALGLVAAAL